MKVIKIIGIAALCLAIIMSFAACAKKGDSNPSSAVTSSESNAYSYAIANYGIAEATKISDFMTEELGPVYKDDSTGEDGFKLHYTPKYTIRKDGKRYTLVLVTMDVLNFETGNIAYVSEVGYYAINDDKTEVYNAGFPINGKIEVDISKNLKK